MNYDTLKNIYNYYMPTVDFIKMNGLGNDFVVLDQAINKIMHPQALATVISDRTYGIGCDQMILLDSSSIADVSMYIFNRDGSRSNMCGNALRCVGKYLMAKDGKSETSIEINDKIYLVHKNNELICVNIGKPKFDWQDIPMSRNMNILKMNYSIEEFSNPSSVNVGNPHIIFFTEQNINEIDLHRLGPLIEKDSLFPEGINVSFVNIVSQGSFKIRVWERGTGETLACGSAACALGAIAQAKGIIDKSCDVLFKRGSIKINILSEGSIEMEGDASVEYNGKFVWKD